MPFPSAHVLELGAGRKLYSILEAGSYAGTENLAIVDPSPPDQNSLAIATDFFSSKGGSLTYFPSIMSAPKNFDVVVTSLCLCSVVSLEETVQDIYSVLKGGGRYAFIEHVLSDDRPIFRLQQKLLDPLQQSVAHNCHLCRSSREAIEEVFDECIFHKRFDKEMWPISEQLYGYALKR